MNQTPFKYVPNTKRSVSSIENAHGEIIALLNTNNPDLDNERGQLFAAAPELLEALLDAFVELNYYWRHDFAGRPVAARIQAALAKAQPNGPTQDHLSQPTALQHSTAR